MAVSRIICAYMYDCAYVVPLCVSCESVVPMGMKDSASVVRANMRAEACYMVGCSWVRYVLLTCRPA